MKDIGTVTVDGVTYTLDGYLAMQASAEKSKELKDTEFIKTESSKYAYAARSRYTKPNNATKKQGVTYEKHYTKTEIIKEELKMGLRSKDSAQYRLLIHMAKNAGRGFSVSSLVPIFNDIPKGTVSGALRRIMKYLVPEGIVKASKDGRRTYYTFVAEIEPRNIEDEITALYDKFLDWETDANRKFGGTPQTATIARRSAKRNIKKPIAPVQPPDASDPLVDKISEVIIKKLSSANFGNNLNVNITVMGKLEIMFGLISSNDRG